MKIYQYMVIDNNKNLIEHINITKITYFNYYCTWSGHLFYYIR